MEDPHNTPHTKTVQNNRTPNRRMETKLLQRIPEATIHTYPHLMSFFHDTTAT